MTDDADAAALKAVDDLDAVLRVLRQLPKDAQAELRAEVQRITDRHAGAVRSAMAGWPDRRVRELAPTVRAKKDRVPVILIGKAARLSALSGRPKGTDVLYGAEFGAAQDGPNGFRFPPRTARLGRGNVGHTIYPALRDQQAALASDWEAAVLRAVERWGD